MVGMPVVFFDETLMPERGVATLRDRESPKTVGEEEDTKRSVIVDMVGNSEGFARENAPRSQKPDASIQGARVVSFVPGADVPEYAKTLTVVSPVDLRAGPL